VLVGLIVPFKGIYFSIFGIAKCIECNLKQLENILSLYFNGNREIMPDFVDKHIKLSDIILDRNTIHQLSI